MVVLKVFSVAALLAALSASAGMEKVKGGARTLKVRGFIKSQDAKNVQIQDRNFIYSVDKGKFLKGNKITQGNRQGLYTFADTSVNKFEKLGNEGGAK